MTYDVDVIEFVEQGMKVKRDAEIALELCGNALTSKVCAWVLGIKPDTLAKYEHNPLIGMPTLVRHRYENGRAYYIKADVEAFIKARFDRYGY